MKGQGRSKKNRLAARQKDYDSMPSQGGNADGKWVKTQLGKNQFFRRPGSNKQ